MSDPGPLLNVAMLRWFDELSNQGIFTTDNDLVVRSWNHWLQRHSGRLASEVVGRPLTEVCPEIAERRIDRYYSAALNGEANVLAYTLHRYLLNIPNRATATGGVMAQSSRIAPLVVEGRIVGTITVIDDVTERVAREAEMRRQIASAERAREVAEDALRTKDEFLATLSHEIRTPLNAVIGWTKILLGRKADPEMVQRALTIIDRNAIAQARLIEDLLDMARIMSGKLRLEMQPVDLVAITSAAIDVVTPAATAKGVAIKPELGTEPCAIIADGGRIQQVAWNLLSNAVKFTPSGGQVAVRIEQDDDAVRLVVRDTGEGIAQEFLPHVFERFRQANASASRTEGGLGLGLALVRELVELHGGTINVESAGRGLGTAVTVLLPLPRIPVPGETGVYLPDKMLDGINVLIVDDDADWRELLAVALSEHGAGITTAASTSQALEMLRVPQAALPNALIVDIGMPGADGYALVSQLRALDGPAGRIPAIAVTAYAGPDYARRAYEAGFQLHKAKPLSPDAVAEAVLEVLQLDRTLR